MIKTILNKKLFLYALTLNLLVTSTGCGKSKLNEDLIYEEEVKTTEEITEVIEDEKENENQIIQEDDETKILEELNIRKDNIINALKDGSEEFLKAAEEDLIFVIDFVSGDTEINGIYFNDLTDKVKQEAGKIIETITNTYTEVSKDPMQAIEDFGYYLYEKEEAVKNWAGEFYEDNEEKFEAVKDFGKDTYEDITENAKDAWERFRN